MSPSVIKALLLFGWIVIIFSDETKPVWLLHDDCQLLIFQHLNCKQTESSKIPFEVGR